MIFLTKTASFSKFTPPWNCFLFQGINYIVDFKKFLRLFEVFEYWGSSKQWTRVLRFLKFCIFLVTFHILIFIDLFPPKNLQIFMEFGLPKQKSLIICSFLDKILGIESLFQKLLYNSILQVQNKYQATVFEKQITEYKVNFTFVIIGNSSKTMIGFCVFNSLKDTIACPFTAQR